MSKLKPCPFCGGEAKSVCLYNDYTTYIIRCCKCWIKTDIGTKQEVIESWNRRIK